jgi:hypothetical protein
MSVSELLGWAKQLLDTFGVTQLIVAFMVISLAAAVVRALVRRD